MRLTEMLHYYNSKTAPSRTWIKYHYSHFDPSVEDQKAREEYQKQGSKKEKKVKMKDIFG